MIAALQKSTEVEFSPDCTKIRKRRKASSPSPAAVEDKALEVATDIFDELRGKMETLPKFTGPKRWEVKQPRGLKLISQRDVAAEGKTLYVKGFPDVVDSDAIKSQFEAFVEVTKVVLLEEHGKAFIFFSSPEHVDSECIFRLRRRAIQHQNDHGFLADSQTPLRLRHAGFRLAEKGNRGALGKVPTRSIDRK